MKSAPPAHFSVEPRATHCLGFYLLLMKPKPPSHFKMNAKGRAQGYTYTPGGNQQRRGVVRFIEGFHMEASNSAG